jgi:hypothetical protein
LTLTERTFDERGVLGFEGAKITRFERGPQLGSCLAIRVDDPRSWSALRLPLVGTRQLRECCMSRFMIGLEPEGRLEMSAFLVGRGRQMSELESSEAIAGIGIGRVAEELLGRRAITGADGSDGSLEPDDLPRSQARFVIRVSPQ